MAAGTTARAPDEYVVTTGMAWMSYQRTGAAPHARGATADLAGDFAVSRLFIDLIVAAAREVLSRIQIKASV